MSGSEGGARTGWRWRLQISGEWSLAHQIKADRGAAGRVTWCSQTVPPEAVVVKIGAGNGAWGAMACTGCSQARAATTIHGKRRAGYRVPTQEDIAEALERFREAGREVERLPAQPACGAMVGQWKGWGQVLEEDV